MRFRLHYWPALSSGWIVLTFIVSYMLSVLTGNVQPFFPYISETGAKPPASCVFGQMMNIAAAITAITLYIRYRQVDFAISSGDTDLPKKWNSVAFWLGNIIALGISIVGNFQADFEGTIFVLTLHILGAVMAFGVGAIYITLQTKFTFALNQSIHLKYPKYGVGRNILYFRIFLTVWFYVLLFSTFFSTAICCSIAVDNCTGDDDEWWKKEHDCYAVHLVSTFSEWLMVLIFMVYMVTVTNEFRSLEYKEICFKSKCVR